MKTTTRQFSSYSEWAMATQRRHGTLGTMRRCRCLHNSMMWWSVICVIVLGTLWYCATIDDDRVPDMRAAWVAQTVTIERQVQAAEDRATRLQQHIDRERMLFLSDSGLDRVIEAVEQQPAADINSTHLNLNLSADTNLASANHSHDDPLYRRLVHDGPGLRHLPPLGSFRLWRIEPDGRQLDARFHLLSTVLHPNCTIYARATGPELAVAQVHTVQSSAEAVEYSLDFRFTRPGHYVMDVYLLLPFSSSSSSSSVSLYRDHERRPVPVYARVEFQLRGTALEQRTEHRLGVCGTGWNPGRWLRNTQGYRGWDGETMPVDVVRDSQLFYEYLSETQDKGLLFHPYHCRYQFYTGPAIQQCMRRHQLDGVVFLGDEDARDQYQTLLEFLQQRDDSRGAVHVHEPRVSAMYDWLWFSFQNDSWHENHSPYQFQRAPDPGPRLWPWTENQNADNDQQQRREMPPARAAAQVLLVARTQESDVARAVLERHFRLVRHMVPEPSRQLVWADDSMWTAPRDQKPVYLRQRNEDAHQLALENQVRVLATEVLAWPLLGMDTEQARRLQMRMEMQMLWNAVCNTM